MGVSYCALIFLSCTITLAPSYFVVPSTFKMTLPSSLANPETPRRVQEVVTRELRSSGPPPPQWYAQYESTTDDLKFQAVNDEAVYDDHPLSSAFRSAYPDFAFDRMPQRPTIQGAVHALAYQAGEWKWDESFGGFTRAIAGSLNDIHTATSRPYIYQADVDARVTAMHSNPAREQPPQEFYHPSDRSSFQRVTRTAERETDAAMLARNLGYSLVVVEVPDSTLTQVLEPTFSQDIITRWSLGEWYELFPPLYVGRFLGSWYSLGLNDRSFYAHWDTNT